MHFRPIGKTKLMALCSIRHAAAIGIAIAPPAPNSGFRPASGGIYRLERYGQEFAASAPFAYFADHQGELGEKIKHGRLEFLHQFPSLAAEAMPALLPDPTDAQVFASCKLDFSERGRHSEAYALHRDLLRLRREDPAFAAQPVCCVDGAVIGDNAFVLRFFAPAEDRLLLVNLGIDAVVAAAPEPLLAPDRMYWRALWSSEDPCYGGSGGRCEESATGWSIVGKSACFFAGFPR
jgi:maltooligosyltrehalose trehalohydrolase